MTEPTKNDIWVFGDLRSRALLNLSFHVLFKTAGLAEKTGARVVLFLLTPEKTPLFSHFEEDACTVSATLEEEAIYWGADVVYRFENDGFSSPTVHDFANTLAPIFRQESPRLVLFPLTDFGRDLAARTAAKNQSGLMADCVDLSYDEENGLFVGLCPAWGGEIMAEITYAPGQKTGFATVHPHGVSGEKDVLRKGRVQRFPLTEISKTKGIRLVSSNPVTMDRENLETADTVVVGGAGMGSMENFGQIRQLAAAMAGQVAATRPPVLNHWVDEDRLIGQTGKTVRPKLLLSVGTSGAVQYTAGIMESGTIVAINRDPSSPIFRLADIGIVADAPTFLPLLIEKTRQSVMRRLADEICTDITAQPEKGNTFGEKIRSLRKAQGWSREQLAETTGQTPDFINDVESGVTSPPAAFLLRLSAAYGVDPGTFLRSEEKERIRDQRTQAYVNRTRNYSYQTLTSGAEQDHLRAFMVTIEPHHDHKPVAYKHEGEEFIFVMEGELEFTLGNKVHILKVGESIHFHSNIPHKLKSMSGDITKCLVILYTI